MKLLLADDHAIIREGLCKLLQQSGHTILGEAEDGRTAVRLATELQPDVIVMDIGMPGMNGIEATRLILEKTPTAKVVALSMHSDATYVGRMLQAGARGYLLKESAFDELSQAIENVTKGRIYLGRKIQGVVVGDYVERLSGNSSGPAVSLTNKEREVLQLVAEGKSTKEIAQALTITVKTVETHRHNIMDRLGIRSIAQLTKYAIRQGLTSLDS
ncbi:MAG: response regulator transcription factor [Planctomycetes bacterium]|jgi:DNA-binding NarL/FixJ family response regulator|nr:response regulator transcription factor [Planctomycetota bacterium]